MPASVIERQRLRWGLQGIGVPCLHQLRERSAWRAVWVWAVGGLAVAQAENLIVCHKTYTNERTHNIVRAHAHALPAYESGEGKGAGPRYCPSLFSKVERFGDRNG